jgi:hypothetical protein
MSRGEKPLVRMKVVTRKRFASALLLAFHVLAAGLAPLIDAAAPSTEEGQHLHAPTHDRSGERFPGHAHDDCQICRLIHSGVAPASPPERARAVSALELRLPESRLDAPAKAGRTLPLGSRAPPTA